MLRAIKNGYIMTKGYFPHCAVVFKGLCLTFVWFYNIPTLAIHLFSQHCIIYSFIFSNRFILVILWWIGSLTGRHTLVGDPNPSQSSMHNCFHHGAIYSGLFTYLHVIGQWGKNRKSRRNPYRHVQKLY